MAFLTLGRYFESRFERSASRAIRALLEPDPAVAVDVAHRLVPASVRDKVAKWSDYIDYWAVDCTFGSEGDTDTFRNQWQSYRTRAECSLELTAHHDYGGPGTWTVLVKVVDIFGNDTSTATQVTVA